MLALLGASAAAAATAGTRRSRAGAAGEDVEWSYSGDTGPNTWGSLSPEFATCSSGTTQSPIDIDESALPAPSPDGVTLSWSPVRGEAENNGHTLHVAVEAGATAVIDGVPFTMVQFHYHAPSETMLDGRAFPVELHFVHQSDAGDLGVVGLWVKRGAASKVLRNVLAAAPAKVGDQHEVKGRIDLPALLPADLSAVRFPGSLTTPPCAEGVAWTMLTNPITMNRRQIRKLARYLGPNARPPQPLNDRSLILVEIDR